MQHDHAVGDLQRVQDVVGDHDYSDAALLDLLDQLQPAPGLGYAQGGERLVEQHQPAAPMDEAGQLDRLPLAARERVDTGAQRGDAAAERAQGRGGLGLHLALAQPAQARDAPGQLAAHEEVGDDVDVRAQGEILVDRLDAGGLGVGRARERDLLSLDRERAAARRLGAGDDLDQRRLAGPVVAQQRRDLAGMDVEADALQRGDRAVALGDISDRQERYRSSSRPVVAGR